MSNIKKLICPPSSCRLNINKVFETILFTKYNFYKDSHGLNNIIGKTDFLTFHLFDNKSMNILHKPTTVPITYTI